MAYIDPPLPPDSVVIWPETDDQPAFTWGDHRKLSAMIDELEESEPAVATARLRLDAAMVETGFMSDGEIIKICEFCHKPEGKPHDIECRDSDDPSLWVKREALSYQYLDDKFVVIHITSVPMTDEEALEYFGLVDLMFPDEVHPKYITRKGLTESTWSMMPYIYDHEANEYDTIEGAGS
jgi:hypothetical protein